MIAIYRAVSVGLSGASSSAYASAALGPCAFATAPYRRRSSNGAVLHAEHKSIYTHTHTCTYIQCTYHTQS